MGWKASCVMDERMKFVVECISGDWTIAEACRRAGISRKTGYKWLTRHAEEGVDGLKDRSRASVYHPNAIDEESVQDIVAMKAKHIDFGPAKVRARLMALHPHRPWPAASTMGDILKRHGLVVPRKTRLHATPASQPLSHCTKPNEVWCADFKGWFRTGDGERCEPLTISDGDSRFLLCCQTMFYGTAFQQVKPYFELAFRQFGLPRAMRIDNGPPFASVGLCGLSRLSVWWLRLGIQPERIRPGKPQDNGRHERMHRTLKQATATPPEENLKAQQRAFEKFIHEYNYERPHQALGQQTPASHYVPSERAFPSRLPDAPGFPEDWEVRSVRGAGHIRWGGDDLLISHALRGERIGLAPIKDGLWEIYFCGQFLGHLDERQMRVIAPEKIKK